MKPQAAREHLGYSIYQLARTAGLARTSIDKLEAGGPGHGRKMTVIALLKVFEVLYPHCRLRDLVGQGCPWELVPISKVAEARVENAQIERLSEENRRLRSQMAWLYDQVPDLVAASRTAVKSDEGPAEECSTASNA